MFLQKTKPKIKDNTLFDMNDMFDSNPEADAEVERYKNMSQAERLEYERNKIFSAYQKSMELYMNISMGVKEGRMKTEDGIKEFDLHVARQYLFLMVLEKAFGLDIDTQVQEFSDQLNGVKPEDFNK